METIDGEVMRLSDLRGTPIFLNFWATWCFSCVSEMPASLFIDPAGVIHSVQYGVLTPPQMRERIAPLFET